jgi:hypothetical protein
MNWNILLVLLGVLGCCAAIRTTRREGVRVLLIAVLVVCLVVGGVNRFMQPAAAPEEAAANREAATGFFARQMEAVRTDACLLHLMHETPLEPVAYLLQMKTFMEGYRKAQVASVLGQATLGQTADLFTRSFGETEEELSPEEARAVQGKAGSESLCQAFGKWAAKVSGYDAVDQRAVWDKLQAKLAPGSKPQP